MIREHSTRRAGLIGSASRQQLAISLALALGFVGFVAAAQWNSETSRTAFTSSAQQVLAGQVVALEEEQRRLREEIAAQEAQIAAFQERGGSSQTELSALNDRLGRARFAAGLTAARGPGVVVEIADSNLVVPEDGNPTDYIVQVEDLRDIVVALWASGAEAISIGTERLVSTTSIYGVGSSILVNDAHLSPTFQIFAIGPADLEERFTAHPAFRGRVERRIQAFGLEFAGATLEQVDVPAFAGSTRFRWAIPVSGDEP